MKRDLTAVLNNRFMARNVDQAAIAKRKEQQRREELEKAKRRAYDKAYKQMQILLEKRKGQQQALRDAGY